MEHIKVSSSIISEIGYDPGTKILEIKFKENGMVKQYLNFPELTYNHFIACTSIGLFFMRFIDRSYEELEVNQELY